MTENQLKNLKDFANIVKDKPGVISFIFTDYKKNNGRFFWDVVRETINQYG